MRPRDRQEADRLSDAISEYERQFGVLPGIAASDAKSALIEQLLESEHRVAYISRLHDRDIAPSRADPASELFNPLKGAVLRQRAGDAEDATWLVFLFVHYGRHRRHPWAYARMTYAGTPEGEPWNWARVAADVEAFERWMKAAAPRIRATGGGFGNHRKYERLEDTGRVVRSYLEWTDRGSQLQRLAATVRLARGNPQAAFAELYESLSSVHRFGRMARLDYLSTIGRLGIAEISADRAYVEQATGPARGAALLWRGDPRRTARPRDLDKKVTDLGRALNLGPDVLEDAICNWQKSPNEFKPFRA